MNNDGQQDLATDHSTIANDRPHSEEIKQLLGEKRQRRVRQSQRLKQDDEHEHGVDYSQQYSWERDPTSSTVQEEWRYEYDYFESMNKNTKIPRPKVVQIMKVAVNLPEYDELREIVIERGD